MDVSRELLAAIGEVVVEATKLEHALARLVTVRWGWNHQQELSLIARSGHVRQHVSKLVDADPDWDAMRRLRRDAFAVLDDRHKLVHSVVVYVEDDDNEVSDIELWHAGSGTTAALPSVSAVEEHAFDIGRCFVTAVRLLPEAEERLQQLGATAAPRPPRPLPSPMTA
jgi:hypothetical protein